MKPGRSEVVKAVLRFDHFEDGVAFEGVKNPVPFYPKIPGFVAGEP